MNERMKSPSSSLGFESGIVLMCDKGISLKIGKLKREIKEITLNHSPRLSCGNQIIPTADVHVVSVALPLPHGRE